MITKLEFCSCEPQLDNDKQVTRHRAAPAQPQTFAGLPHIAQPKQRAKTITQPEIMQALLSRCTSHDPLTILLQQSGMIARLHRISCQAGAGNTAGKLLPEKADWSSPI